MREITCSEFIALLDQALAGLARDWCEASSASPEDYPERMAIGDWSRHICCTLVPELELRSAGACPALGDYAASPAAE